MKQPAALDFAKSLYGPNVALQRTVEGDGTVTCTVGEMKTFVGEPRPVFVAHGAGDTWERALFASMGSKLGVIPPGQAPALQLAGKTDEDE